MRKARGDGLGIWVTAEDMGTWHGMGIHYKLQTDGMENGHGKLTGLGKRRDKCEIDDGWCDETS